MLPQMDKPKILDIGCGCGIPTLELAKLSHGEIVATDIDQPALDRLNRRKEETGLAERVQTVHCSMFDMEFPPRNFDIIWSEGSIYAIGFEKGIREWKRFLKPGGFMVVHDEQGNVRDKLKEISNCGYELLGYFLLSKETWWAEYFAPIERLIGEFQAIYAYAPTIHEEVHQAQNELDMFNKHPERNSSVYFVIKKK